MLKQACCDAASDALRAVLVWLSWVRSDALDRHLTLLAWRCSGKRSEEWRHRPSVGSADELDPLDERTGDSALSGLRRIHAKADPADVRGADRAEVALERRIEVEL